jgi:hypothetical protein
VLGVTDGAGLRPAEAAGVPQPAGPARDPLARRELLVVLVLLAVAPILVAGIQGAIHPWYPAGDWADVALGALQVGTRNTPLVGVYSRYGWNHPGPMLFWLYAVPYRLMGARFAGMIVAAALINAASVAGSVVLAWRRGRAALAVVVALVLALTAQTMGLAILRDPWNPWVTVLPFGLLVMATWSAVEGDGVGLIVIAVVGSFLAQTHVGFVPFLALAAIAGAVGFWFRRRPTGAAYGSARPLRRPLVVAAAVLLLCWAPVLVDVVTGGDNVSRLVVHFTGDTEQVGLGYAYGVTALELGGYAPWLGADEPGSPAGGGVEPGGTGALVLSLSAFAGALALAWWRRRESPGALRFQAVVGLGALAGLVAVSRISGIVFSYLIRWWWPLAALWWASIVWSVWGALHDRLRSPLRVAVVGVAALYLATIGFQTVSQPAEMLESIDENAAQEPLAVLTDGALPQVPTDRTVLFRQIGPGVGWVGDGIALQLIRSGRDTRFEDEETNRYKYGEGRITRADASQAGVVLMSGIGIEDLERRGGGRELGRWDPLPPAERGEAWQLQRHLRSVFSGLGREDLVSAIDGGTSLWDAKDLSEVDKAELTRFEELRRWGEPLALFLYERADAAPRRS